MYILPANSMSVPKKKLTITIAIAAAVIAISAIYIMTFSSGGPWHIYQGHQNAKYLSTVHLLDDKSSGVSSPSQGDALFGVTPPAIEHFYPNRTFASVYSDLTRNLTAQGYSISPKYDLGSNDGISSNNIVQIGMVANKAEQHIFFNIILKQPYYCSNDTKAQCSSNVFSYPEVASSQVIDVKVDYNGYDKNSSTPTNF